MTEHGVQGYNHGCRCPRCKQAKGDYASARRLGLHNIDRDALADILNDICPNGLTTDSPRGRHAAAARVGGHSCIANQSTTLDPALAPFPSPVPVRRWDAA